MATDEWTDAASTYSSSVLCVACHYMTESFLIFPKALRDLHSVQPLNYVMIYDFFQALMIVF